MDHYLALLEDRIRTIREQLVNVLGTDDNGNTCLSDPNDRERIGAHYGETHFCAALFLEALINNQPVDGKATELLEGIIANRQKDEKLPSYHGDFNHFALAIILLKCPQFLTDDTRKRLTDLLLGAADSPHSTVNWLPMRAYVALARFRLTGQKEYLNDACKWLKETAAAQYPDGLFEDLLPKGSTLSLQYSISTAATIQLIYDDFSEYRNMLPEFDLKKTAETLYLLELPDGDINYFGRGTNQIFAWGPWLFLGKHYYNEKIEKSALFLADGLDKSVKECNLMLSGLPGSERCLWWDYHHYSVYISHFLFWYTLTRVTACERTQTDERKETTCESGFSVFRKNGNVVVSFSGRKSYLAERGPAVCAVYLDGVGAVFKGGHGPACNHFSQKNSRIVTSYLNHFGPAVCSEASVRSQNRIVRKLQSLFHEKDAALTVCPSFSFEKAIFTNHEVEIYFKGNEKKPESFILPLANSSAISRVELAAEGKTKVLIRVGSIETQYGEIGLYSSPIVSSKDWKLKIRIG